MKYLPNSNLNEFGDQYIKRYKTQTENNSKNGLELLPKEDDIISNIEDIEKIESVRPTQEDENHHHDKTLHTESSQRRVSNAAQPIQV